MPETRKIVDHDDKELSQLEHKIEAQKRIVNTTLSASKMVLKDGTKLERSASYVTKVVDDAGARFREGECRMIANAPLLMAAHKTMQDMEMEDGLQTTFKLTMDAIETSDEDDCDAAHAAMQRVVAQVTGHEAVNGRRTESRLSIMTLDASLGDLNLSRPEQKAQATALPNISTGSMQQHKQLFCSDKGLNSGVPNQSQGDDASEMPSISVPKMSGSDIEMSPLPPLDSRERSSQQIQSQQIQNDSMFSMLWRLWSMKGPRSDWITQQTWTQSILAVIIGICIGVAIGLATGKEPKLRELVRDARVEHGKRKGKL